MVNLVVSDWGLSEVHFAGIVVAESIFEGKAALVEFVLELIGVPIFLRFEVFIGGRCHDFGDVMGGGAAFIVFKNFVGDVPAHFRVHSYLGKGFLKFLFHNSSIEENYIILHQSSNLKHQLKSVWYLLLNSSKYM